MYPCRHDTNQVWMQDVDQIDHMENRFFISNNFYNLYDVYVKGRLAK